MVAVLLYALLFLGTLAVLSLPPVTRWFDDLCDKWDKR